MKAIAAGDLHSLVLALPRDLAFTHTMIFGWGANPTGALGNNDGDRLRPDPQLPVVFLQPIDEQFSQETPLTDLTAIASGRFHCLAMRR